VFLLILKTFLVLIKWLRIKETNAIKLEKLFKKLRDKLFLTDRLNTQFPITFYLLFKN